MPAVGVLRAACRKFGKIRRSRKRTLVSCNKTYVNTCKICVTFTRIDAHSRIGVAPYANTVFKNNQTDFGQFALKSTNGTIQFASSLLLLAKNLDSVSRKNIFWSLVDSRPSVRSKRYRPRQLRVQTAVAVLHGVVCDRTGNDHRDRIRSRNTEISRRTRFLARLIRKRRVASRRVGRRPVSHRSPPSPETSSRLRVSYAQEKGSRNFREVSDLAPGVSRDEFCTILRNDYSALFPANSLVGTNVYFHGKINVLSKFLYTRREIKANILS